MIAKRKWLLLAMAALASMVQGQTEAGDFQTIDIRDGLSESRIRALCQLPDGRVAVATTATIDLFDGTHFDCHPLPPDRAYPLPGYHGGHQMTADSLGLLWLRNAKKLYVLDSHAGQVVENVDSLLRQRGWTVDDIEQWPKKRVQKQMMGVEQVKDTLHDCYGGLWIGTQENGILYTNAARARQFHTAQTPFNQPRRQQFCSPRTSQLAAKYAPDATNCTLDARSMSYAFLGTRQGLMVFDEADSLVAVIDRRYGLATDIVQSVANDAHDDVWMATTCGVSRLRVVGRDSFAIVNYNRLDGIMLEGREFRDNQLTLTPDGHILLGFAGGVVSFCPDSVTAPRHTFLFPSENSLLQEQPAEAEAHNVSVWYWIVAILLALWAATVTFLHFRSKPSTNPSAPRRESVDVEQQLKSLDQTFTRIAAEANPLTDDEQFLAKLKQTVEEHLSEEDFSVQQLSELMAMDRTVLYRRMQQLTGLSPSVYVKNIRMKVAERLLKETTIPISEIADKTGFSTTKYFNRVFKEHYGMMAVEYREQQMTSNT